MDRKERINEAYQYLYKKGIIHEQKDLAAIMKASKSNISSALSGKTSVLTDSFIRRFCDAFKGTFNENITNETVFARTPAWTIADDSALKNYTSFTGEVEFPLNPQYVSALAAQDGTDDNDVSYSLLMMPQSLGNDVVVEVTYEVGGEIKTRTVQLNQYPASNPVTVWEIGTKYTYRLVYSREAQRNDIIYFSPETSGWTELEAIEVIL